MWPGEIQKNTSNIFAFNTFDDTVIWLSAHRPLRNPTINWMSLVHCDPFLETPVHSGRNWFSHMDVLSLFSQSPFHVGVTISLPKNRHVKASYSWRWNHIGPALGDPLIWQGSPAGGILKSKQLLLCWNPKDHCCRLLPFWLWKDPFEFKFSLPRRTKQQKQNLCRESCPPMLWLLSSISAVCIGYPQSAQQFSTKPWADCGNWLLDTSEKVSLGTSTLQRLTSEVS